MKYDISRKSERQVSPYKLEDTRLSRRERRQIIREVAKSLKRMRA
tara:strand:- start:881 stop:1015 length:135 start_codon:yes stop_codon:yes gene_type:complete